MPPPAMALRQLIACVLCMFLLLAVAAAAGPSPLQPQDLVGRVHTGCANTLNVVPWDCADQFIRAILSRRTADTIPVTYDCCAKLACVREGPCVDLLRRVCLPPHRGYCQ
ncbi:hypothetical protein CFC21_044530 [Triticum aestivum]|uniref:Uncharacterized protein n=3 Tax=Triticum TaxID=4564 RepID=A0A9R1S9L7_TRITD|nr:hypothetical protein CFC21_044530 [Triticum aestivum]VAH85566.1 unnamed protein product [Triticum turgidum subsp. durum]